MKPWIILLLLFGIPISYAPAQQWGFESLGIERGLPASESYNMFRDDKGYIYVATAYGMVKYNGSRFVPVCCNIPVRERIAYAFCKGQNGEYCFVNAQAHFYTIRNDSAFLLKISGKPVAPFIGNAPINPLFMDSSGNLFAGTTYKGFMYEAFQEKWSILKDEEQLSDTALVTRISNGFFSSAYSRNGGWVLVRNTAYAGFYRLPNAPGGKTRYKVTESDRGLYLFWDKQLYQITKQGTIKAYVAQGNILNLNFSPDGHVWLGLQYKGLVELDTNLRPRQHYLDRLSIANVLFDNQEGIWVSSLEQGVFHCKNRHEYHYDHHEGFSGEIRFMKQIGDRLFAGSINGKLLVTSADGSRMVTLGKQGMQDVIPWQKGYLVAAANCIFFLDQALHASIRVPELSCYRLLPRGDDFLRAGPISLSLFSSRYKLKRESELSSKIRCLLPLGIDSMYVGCVKGLHLILNDEVTTPPGLHSLSSCCISDLKKSIDGTIWIGTKGDGLFKLSPGRKPQNIPAPSGIITHISFFGDSIMLLSTNIGLYAGHAFRANPEWTNLYDGEIMNALPFHGQIFIGTKHGLVAYDTAALFSPTVFPVYLNAVHANGRRVNLRDILIQPGERDLTFNFDVLSYTRQAAPLHYQLEGPLSSEGQVAGTSLFLQNLPPGHYLLRIYVDKRQALAVPFFIRPAFWQTGVFLLFISVGGSGLLLAGAYLLYRRTRKAAYKKAAIGRMLSEYKLVALKAQINPHFMSNSLAAIQQLMLSNQVDKAGRYLALFSLLIRQVLQYSDKSLVSLSEELKIVELNVSLEQLRFADQFVFETELDPGIDPQRLYIPPLITQPFIENAIWHGLLPLKGSRLPRLLVRVANRGDQVILSVIDNGVGRAVHRGQNYFRSEAFTSKGLDLTRSRIENLNQLYPDGNAQMTILDLHDKSGPAGTQVDIVLPYIPSLTYGKYYPESYNR